jgi:hypothetical protein
MSHGRTDGEQRFSPPAEIDTTNVGPIRVCSCSAAIVLDGARAANV